MDTPPGGDAGGAPLSSETVRAAIDRRWGADAGGVHRCERRCDPRPPQEEPVLTREVARRDASSLSYEEFWREYMERNQPLVIAGITHAWKAAREWVEVPRSDGDASPLEARHGNGAANTAQPALGALEAAFGEEKVCVALCGEKHFSDQRREEVRLSAFIEEWRGIIRDRKLTEQLPRRALSPHPEEVELSTSDRPIGVDKSSSDHKSSSDRGGAGWQGRVRDILARELRGMRGAERRGEAWEGFAEEHLGRLPYC